MKKKGKLLIADDNKSVLKALQLFLKHHFEELLTCNNPNQIPSLMQQIDFDLVLLDMNFAASVNTGNEGLYWLKQIRKINKRTVVIVFTAYGDINLAVESMKHGASDFILKPWDNNKLLASLKSGLELSQVKCELEEANLHRKLLTEDLNQPTLKMIGESKAIKSVYSLIGKLAKTDANVLILGENGTGKEIVAREIHKLSERKKQVFMNVDLGALNESIFESELFGHVKGAFTDAKEHRIGRFQAASKGTLFLDEIGNLSQSMQAKLLSVLQNRKVTSVGSNKEEDVDIRLITATNSDILKLVQKGSFREDLLYRINTLVINMPPLRERGNDIILIAVYYLQKYADKYAKPYSGISKMAKEKLLNYSWPGNIRELKHCMERTIIIADKTNLDAVDFQLEENNNSVKFNDKAISLEEGEKMIICGALKRHKGNISNVARELNIGRQTLYRKIEKYNIL